MSTKGIESSDGGIEGMSENKEFFQPQFLRTYFRVDQWIREPNKGELLKYVDDQTNPVVNLSGDPVLHVVIAYGESKLACELIDMMQKPEGSQRLLDMKNKITKDTALHVAASMGDETVAEKLLNTDFNLLHELNEEKETPLHKAAFYGQSSMFKMLENEDNISARTADGNTILHCAILGEAPELALYIVDNYPHLTETRNKEGATPLQLLLASVPAILLAKERLTLLDTIIYKLIFVDEKNVDKLVPQDLDPENPRKQINRIYVHKSHNVIKYYGWKPIAVADRVKLAKPIVDIVIGVRKILLKIRSKICPRIDVLCSIKEEHGAYMKLIQFIAYNTSYWHFLNRGRTGDNSDLAWMLHEEKIEVPTIGDNETTGKPTNTQYMTKKKNIWNESPLTLGIKMGLYDFVEQILIVSPASSLVLDQDDHNILQVAIDNGQDRIVDLIVSLACADNPVLSSTWLSSVVSTDGSNIGHFAANATVNEKYASPLQLRREMRWFKRVQRLVPKELRHSRNKNQQTARELFSEKHKAMLDKAQNDLTKRGELCSGLVAAVVFASSFTIPGDKVNGKPMYMERLAFKVFSHAYVIGLSCASTALVLCLSFATSQYREEDFVNYIPTKYRFAALSFIMALVALLVAFSCNIYLSIYGGEKVEVGRVIPFVCELLVLPTIFLLYLINRQGTALFGITEFLRELF